MKKLLVVIICFGFILYGCDTPKQRVVNDAPSIKRSIEKKAAVSNNFLVDGSVRSISITNQEDFYSINDWYDNNKIIYTIGENGMSFVYLFHLFSGEKALFYQTDDFIVKIEANSDHSLFAIQTIEQSGISHLRIINKLGNEVFSFSKMVDDLQFMWNPYKQDELIVTEFLPYMEFQVFYVNVSSKAINKVRVHNPFVQWTRIDQIGFLDWDQNEPSFDAPLLLFNVNTLKEVKWLEHCIMLLSLKNLIVTASVNPGNLNNVLYTFYDSTTQKKLNEVTVPILSTSSESWWIPSHDYDHERKLFYFMKPNRAGDIAEYNEGYKLSVLSIVSNKEEVLATVPSNFPIKLSPDGKWCLLGEQLEQLINVSNKQIMNLVSKNK